MQQNVQDSFNFTSLIADNQRLSRRSILGWASASAGSMCAWPFGLSGQAAADDVDPHQRFPRMVHEYFVRQVRRAEQRKLRIMSRLETKEDAERYVATVREKIRECFGPEPERTPLNPRVTGIVERDTYRIEKVIFDSRPNFPVTANLYIPHGARADANVPGVIGTCGHSMNGKAAEPYQAFAQGLARLGYACLIYDPLGQGERIQYLDEDLDPTVGGSVHDHLHAGNQQFLVGEFLGMWRAWDGMRALDYLLTRDEVDPQHLGVTGNSGGGTMTTWLCGVENRWTMGAPSCFVTTFLHNMENELPADTEQCPPKALALNLDHDDFLAAMAPKPVIVLAKERDYFDVRGAQEAYERLRRLYELLGAEENIGMFVGPTTHGYSQENREAMYRWFNGVTQVSDARTEPEITIEADETLWCTPNGQVAELEGVRTVFSFTQEKSKRLSEERGDVSGEELLRRVRGVLRLRPNQDSNAPDFRVLRYLQSRGYPKSAAIAYAVETEPDLFALVYMLADEGWYSRPPQGDGESRAVLYVSHHSSDAELRDESLLRDMIAADPDTQVFTCDVRGIGESRPETCGVGSFESPYGCDYFYAIHSLMLDRPYLGGKTHDVLRVLDWMRDHGYGQVHLVGNGWGALPATFAALLSDTVVQVTLKHALTSYAEIAESEHYDWPLSTFLPDVLAHFDLPDCYRALEPKGLEIIAPWGAEHGALGGNGE